MSRTAILSPPSTSVIVTSLAAGAEIDYGWQRYGPRLAITLLGYVSGMRAAPILFALVAFLAIALTAFLLVAGWTD